MRTLSKKRVQYRSEVGLVKKYSEAEKYSEFRNILNFVP